MRLFKVLKWFLIAAVVLAVVASAFVMMLQEPVPVAGTAADGNSRVYDALYEPAITAARDELDSDRVAMVSPSISVAVGVRGELVWADALGYADIGSQTPATPDTVYAIGSVSKPLTATLTALLWQGGELDLDADVRDYVPGFPQKDYPVTLRQLLSHQAGIRHYGFGWKPPTFSESAINREFTTTGESLSLFANDPLLFEPDTGFSYSTFGYTLIAAAIEGVTGQSYINALEDHVLQPLGMAHTTLDDTAYISGSRATDYVGTFSKKAVVRAPETSSSYKWAGGGLVSTPSDLVRFGNAMIKAGLLSETTHAAVFKAREVAAGELNPQHYGLGWRIGGLVVTDPETGEDDVITLINHGGTRAGSTAILMIVPDHDIVVAMASNTVGRGASGPITSVAARVAREFIRLKVAPPVAIGNQTGAALEPNAMTHFKKMTERRKKS